jgi:hypothetical protein
LVKHVCGSCRFFDEAREGKQGWCTHPERRESSSVRILVRAAELRCRDDWGHDKWEARTTSDQVLDVVMNDSATPRPPLTDRRIFPSIELPRTDPVEPAALSTAPLMPVIETPQERDETEPARHVSADLNRELLRQAHAHARQRQQNKGYSIDQRRPAEPEPLVISNQYIPPSGATQTPVSKGLTNSVFEFGGRGGSDESFDAIPDIDNNRDLAHARLAVAPKKDRPRPKIADEQSLSLPAEDNDWHFDAVNDAERRPAATYAAEAWPASDDFAVADIEVPYRESGDDGYEIPVDEGYLPRRNESQPDNWDVARHAAKHPEAHRLWADIARCCMTCRDFRPAGNGERGWCTNQWAFKHRRMVDADDRPCETSIGHWWIPGDEAWQGEFDVSALGQPTPLMDKWVGRSNTDDFVDEPSERRRRRTGSW